MTRRFLRGSALLVLLLLTAITANSALAAHEEGPTFKWPRPLDFPLIEAFDKNLSGSMWLMSKGLDPRLTTAKGNPLGAEFEPKDRDNSGHQLRSPAAADRARWCPTATLRQSSAATSW